MPRRWHRFNGNRSIVDEYWTFHLLRTNLEPRFVSGFNRSDNPSSEWFWIRPVKNLIGSLLTCLLLLTASPMSAFAHRERSNIKSSSLRCEYLVSPLAIDNRQPRLSWTIESNVRGTKQSGYQIIVASSVAGLAE